MTSHPPWPICRKGSCLSSPWIPSAHLDLPGARWMHGDTVMNISEQISDVFELTSHIHYTTLPVSALCLIADLVPNVRPAPFWLWPLA